MINRIRFVGLLFVLLLAVVVTTNAVVASSTTAPITIFELENISLTELHDNPVLYDGTVAYRKISVIGTFSELGPYRSIITQDSYSLIIDSTEEELFAGFNVNDGVKLTGVFYHKQIGDDTFIPNYVLHYPIVELSSVEISDIVKDQESFNGKKVTVIGNLSSIEESMGRYVFYVADPETNDELKVMFCH